MGLLAETRTGKLERTSPLPLGRYWIDVFEPKASVWQSWLSKAGNAVHVESTEAYEGDPDAGYPARNWILFEVLQPVEWGNHLAADLGWPSIASQSVKTSDDTSDKPDPKDVWEDPLGTATEGSNWGWVKWVAGGAVVVGGIWGIAKLVRG